MLSHYFYFYMIVQIFMYLFGISSVGHGPDESVGIYHTVAASDLVSLSLLLSVVVVGVLVIMDVETELVLWVWLQTQTK